jgi:hypothetical protein
MNAMSMVARAVPRPPSESTQIAIRLLDAWLERAEALVPWIARPGVSATKTDVLRAAIAKGLDALEAERRAEGPPKRPPTRGKRL